MHMSILHRPWLGSPAQLQCFYLYKRLMGAERLCLIEQRWTPSRWVAYYVIPSTEAWRTRDKHTRETIIGEKRATSQSVRKSIKRCGTFSARSRRWSLGGRCVTKRREARRGKVRTEDKNGSVDRIRWIDLRSGIKHEMIGFQTIRG